MTKTDGLTKASTSLGNVFSGISKFTAINFDNITSKDVGLMVSGGLDFASAVAEFLPPPASTITGALTGILDIFGIGPPPEPTPTEVINAIKAGQEEIKDEIKAGNQKVVDALTKEIRSGFQEQKQFMYKAFSEQKLYLVNEFDQVEKQFEESKNFQKELFSKELLREVKNDAIALLEHVQEKYGYILPHAQKTLTDIEALDLDQNAGIMDTTFQTARARQAFIDRCPQVFIDQEAMSETNRIMRKLCGLLLQTYFQVEKFRDITSNQLIVILARTSLKRLIDGYLILQDERKRSISEFVDTYLINEVEPTKNQMFCPLFGQFPNIYDNPWISENTRQSVVDYIKFVRSDPIDILTNNYKECNHLIFGCAHNDNCPVTFQYHYGNGAYRPLVLGSFNTWKIAFVSNTAVTLTTSDSQYSSVLPSEIFTINKVGLGTYTFKSNRNGKYIQSTQNGDLTVNSDVAEVQSTFKVASLACGITEILEDGVCTTCSAGEIPDPFFTTCKECASNEYTENGNCITCRGFSVPNPDQTSCEGYTGEMVTLLMTGYGSDSGKMEIIQENGDTKVCPEIFNYPLGQILNAAGAATAAANSDNSITVCGGGRSGSGFGAIEDIMNQCYTLKNSMWEQSAATLKTARWGHGASANGDAILFTGGRINGGGGMTETTENLENGNITPGPNLPRARYDHCQVSYENIIFIIGGYVNPGSTNQFGHFKKTSTVLKYDLDDIDNGFIEVKSMVNPKRGNACTIFNSPAHNGRPVIIVAGGATSEIWDFTTGGSSWEEISNLPLFKKLNSGKMSPAPNGDNVLLTYGKRIYTLKPSGTSYQGEKKKQELSLSHNGHVQLLVPAFWISC